MSFFKAHLFICINESDKGEVCGHLGSKELHARIKKRAGEEWGKTNVRINKSGCLGQCAQGIAAVLYPEGKWFLNLKNDSASEELLLQAIREVVPQ